MNRHIKAVRNGPYQEIVSPGVLRFLDFSRLTLGKGEKHSGQTGEREAVLDFFGGTASISIRTPDGEAHTFAKVGGRPDVFSGPPQMVYIPPRSSCELTARSSLDAGIFTAPSRARTAPAWLHDANVTVKTVGRDNWQRQVYSALDNNVAAERLLAGETLNPPGNWSSYPPHKHDRSNPPQEAVLEEIYFFRIKPSQGYGFIWTYTAADDPEGFSSVFVVEDGDTVLLPKGYHPVVAAPGYQLHYTWVLAGEERRYGAWADDPRHVWVKNA